MVYSLVLNGMCLNIIVAEADFIATITSDYDTITGPYTELDLYPGPGYSYDGVNYFPPPPQEEDPEDG